MPALAVDLGSECVRLHSVTSCFGGTTARTYRGTRCGSIALRGCLARGLVKIDATTFWNAYHNIIHRLLLHKNLQVDEY